MSLDDSLTTPITVLRGRLGAAIRDRAETPIVAEHRRQLVEAKLLRDVRLALADEYAPSARARTAIAALLTGGADR
ncbi:hypothetical protein HDA30_000389 [Micrococcus cohnii]|uniref:Uncharacterized protein n=1 Tax=Micrococcus cohnii TaxID=993416 RepID=A0A7W7M2D1_9MICC|nr:hypothetical protein [Micrococcus cohnii]MBB4734881.1 hypothetical protein [Micrococcus cohnii]